MTDTEPTTTLDGNSAVARLSSTLPAVAAGYLTVGTLEARAVSLRGEAHAFLGEPRQDAFGLLASEDGTWLVCGVADGLGAEPYSAFGAEAALQAGLAALADQLATGDDGSVDHELVVAAAAEAAAASAASLNVPAPAVSTTLTLAGVHAGAASEGRDCVVVTAGDSHALVVRDPGTWTYLTPRDSEAPSNLVATHLPCAPEGALCLGARIEPGDILVIATDGFTVPLGDGTSKMGQHLAGRWLPQPRDLMSFVVDLTFRGHHDDRTALAVWC